MGTNAKTTHTAYAITPAGGSESVDPPEVEDQLPTIVEEPALVEPGQQPVTPIPLTPDVGHAYGEPVLVGGADLIASTATLVSYHSAAGPRTVLHARVDEDAEAKLLDALTISPGMVPTQVEQQVTGRLPVDKQHNLAEKIITAAKSVNHHIANGTLTADQGPPATTAKKIDAAEAALQGVGDAATPVEKAMLDHYLAQLQAVKDAVATGTPVAHVTRSCTKAPSWSPSWSPHPHPMGLTARRLRCSAARPGSSRSWTPAPGRPVGMEPARPTSSARSTPSTSATATRPSTAPTASTTRRRPSTRYVDVSKSSPPRARAMARSSSRGSGGSTWPTGR
ncbi:hypothetical protein AB0J40_28920 [Amycolatopsis sp. NPDC049691]|uniref:hypothetical protein n=1 Tax=Amycolatopsis sp. NPDC049691 TaxID=3155155 RepID=UPI003425ACFF